MHTHSIRILFWIISIICLLLSCAGLYPLLLSFLLYGFSIIFAFLAMRAAYSRKEKRFMVKLHSSDLVYKVTQLWAGYTPTHEEADAILNDLRHVTHGWTPKLEQRSEEETKIAILSEMLTHHLKRAHDQDQNIRTAGNHYTYQDMYRAHLIGAEMAENQIIGILKYVEGTKLIRSIRNSIPKYTRFDNANLPEQVIITMVDHNVCPCCHGGFDTEYECNRCGYDALPWIYKKSQKEKETNGPAI